MSARAVANSVEQWIEYGRPESGTSLRLFCFPFAGGSASIYRQWHGGPLQDIEVCPVQLPGRERRLSETPFLQIPALVRRLIEVLPLERPFAFFGHSMGALIAFELARELRRRGEPLPEHLFVSGAPAPQLRRARPLRSRLNRSELLYELRKLGGTPEEVLENNELIDLVLPAIRADFSIIDTYAYRDEPAIECPISALGGRDDAEVEEIEVMAWRAQCAANFQYLAFAGNHFFVVTEPDAVRAAIALRCSEAETNFELQSIVDL